MNMISESARQLVRRWQELLDEYNELRGERDSLRLELNRKFPKGFTGNGVPGDYESLEMDYADADLALRDWLASDDGQEFKRLRSEREAFV